MSSLALRVPRARFFPRLLVTPVLVVLVSLFVGCNGEENGRPSGSAAMEREDTAQVESAPPPSVAPEDPGKSGVLGALDAESSEGAETGFSVTRGAVRAFPHTLVAKGAVKVEVDRGGTLSFYDGSGGSPDSLRWEREGVLPFVSLGEAGVVVAIPEGVVGLGLEAGEELWRLALDSEPVDMRARRGTVIICAGRTLLWVSSETGTVTARQNLANDGREVLLDPDNAYAVTASGVEAYGENQSLLWRFDAPGLYRATLSGGSGRFLLLETRGGLTAISAEEGELLWDLPEQRPLLRPIVLEERLFLAKENGVLQARSARDGTLLWSDGAAPAIGGRARFWRGSVWIPGGDGRVTVVGSEGGRIGSLDIAGGDIAFLYGNEESLGVIDHFGNYLELTPGGSDLRLALAGDERGDSFDLPALTPGGGPLLFPLKSEPVSLEVELEKTGIYLFRLPLQEKTETVIDLLDESGAVLASNLDKIELAESLRVRLEESEAYQIEARPARDDLVGSLAAVSLGLLRQER